LSNSPDDKDQLRTDSGGPLSSAPPVERRVLRPRQQGSFRAVLGNGPFLRLWIAQAVSQTANSMVDFSLLLRVGEAVDYHNVAQANTAVSFVILAFSLPAVVFGPIAGAVADRMSRRNLMVITNALRAVLVVLFLLVQPTWPVQIALVSYYSISFLFGAVGQFFMPAQGASIPALVPRDQLTAANGLFNLTFTATQLLGFAILGPVLSQALGVDMLFLVTMFAFVISALLTVWLPPMPVVHRVVIAERVNPIRRVWAEIREGLVYIKQDPILMKSIAYLTFATTTFMLVAALAPNFVATVVGLPPSDIGYLVAPAGLGVIAGVVLVPRLIGRFRRDAVVDWAVVVGGLSLLLLALSRQILARFIAPAEVPQMLEVAVAGAFAAILGICNALVLIPSQTILQERSHEHIRARVYATFFTITSVVSFVPIFFAAAAADLWGVVTVLSGVALLLMGVGSLSLLRARQRQRQRHQRVRTRHRQGPEAVPPAG
jgi:MFS family permease